MASYHVWFFISLWFVQGITGRVLGKRNSLDEDEFYSVNKSSLCPVSQKEVFCQGDFDFQVAVADIENSGNKTQDERLPIEEDVSKCRKALKETICSPKSPLCLKKVERDNVTAVRRECDRIYRTCPLLVVNQNIKDYTKDCEAYLTKRFSDMTCKSVGTDFKGVCPRPTKKVPAFYIPLYELKSISLKKSYDFLEDFNARLGGPLSSSCLESVKQLVCLPIYCSDNDTTKVIMKNKKKDCNMTLECIGVALKNVTSPASLFKKALEDVKKFVTSSCDLISETVKVHGNGRGNDKNVENDNPRSLGKILSAQVQLILAIVSFCLKLLL